MDTRIELLTFFLLALVCTCWAARRVDANARARDTMKRRRDSAVMTRQEPGTLDTKELLQLTEGESMNALRKGKDVHGLTLERLQEEYKGIPVLDSVVTVRKDGQGHLTGDASGTLVQDIAEDLPNTEAELSDEQTLDIVINAEGDASLKNVIGDVSFQRLVFLDNNDKARLVNKVSYMIDGVKKPTYFIDLKNGDVLKHWNAFTTLSCCEKSSVKARFFGGNEKSGKIWYGSQPYCLDFTVDDCGICYLENKYVRVVDMNYTTNGDVLETASFPCDQSYDDAINGAFSPAIDAFFHGTVVGKMFEEWFGTPPLKEKPVIRVHYGQFFGNAYWNSGMVTLGDGGDAIYPFTNLDDLGHEIGHGVVEQGSGLLYIDESGGLNEAFADIMGETAEDYLLSTDFVSGQYLMKEMPYMRGFERPELDNHSISHVDDMTPDLNPHLSSGVYRRVWWVVVKEQGMNIRDTFNVFQFANQMYWHPMSTFYDASCGLLKAAMDLGLETKPFATAFEDVGLSKCDISTHVFSVANNETYHEITVSGTFQPVFGFSMPGWGNAVIVEALSPPDGAVGITLFKGSWEGEGQYEAATEVKHGLNRLNYFEEDGTDNNTESQAWVLTEYFIKLSTDNPYDQYDDVELTVGYICDDKYVVEDDLYYAWYRYICYGEE